MTTDRLLVSAAVVVFAAGCSIINRFEDIETRQQGGAGGAEPREDGEAKGTGAGGQVDATGGARIVNAGGSSASAGGDGLAGNPTGTTGGQADVTGGPDDTDGAGGDGSAGNPTGTTSTTGGTPAAGGDAGRGGSLLSTGGIDSAAGGSAGRSETGRSGGTGGAGTGGQASGTCAPACEGETPVCDDGICVACSAALGSRCSGNVPEICVDGQWEPQPACSGDAPLCSNGICTGLRLTGGIVAVRPVAPATGNVVVRNQRIGRTARTCATGTAGTVCVSNASVHP